MSAHSPARFGLGLVVGKFAPLHLGHEWLIHQAMERCDRVLVLSYCNPEFERCGPAARRVWLRMRLPDVESIVLDPESLARECNALSILARPLPDNGSDDLTQQHFLAWLLRCVIRRRPDAIFCSEHYGPSCAALLGAELGSPVAAVVADPDRRQIPISATRIRQRPRDFSDWMAPEVSAAFVRRIAVLGGESSGKTTLAAALAARFGTQWVPEYGRELWERKGGTLLESDLLEIAREHIRREEAQTRRADGFVFCDTSPLTTAGYAGWMFGRVDPMLELLATRQYDGIVLCRPDFPFIQDGTRRDEAFRRLQHEWYLERIPRLGCPMVEAGGSVAERVSTVREWLLGV